MQRLLWDITEGVASQLATKQIEIADPLGRREAQTVGRTPRTGGRAHLELGA